MNVQALETFLKAATWLSDADQVWVVLARSTAEALDNDGTQSALVSQHRQLLLQLEKRRPDGPPVVDPVTAAIDGLRE